MERSSSAADCGQPNKPSVTADPLATRLGSGQDQASKATFSSPEMFIRSSESWNSPLQTIGHGIVARPSRGTDQAAPDGRTWAGLWVAEKPQQELGCEASSSGPDIPFLTCHNRRIYILWESEGWWRRRPLRPGWTPWNAALLPPLPRAPMLASLDRSPRLVTASSPD